ncbi:hypothetical protein A2cp1_0590 [Anaeromyxobacter dehalogenans 2CP-1]|uniref:DUF429 domain-containing protein n=1 Tax=Anaeromyxobacter dehalogenans (strain ATCC BAA-258 / DSM 21875 / 2CP-1) TaxID=455488 RepID=B8JC25_ANAD2|nr:DUF429 domain-containing protein [Anaeromyxobacter dehalogenans]ACL63947.1 hypothetical protein A2cp1_0590 [Anaeromyxobacter dehalogenans 2CP-1]
MVRRVLGIDVASAAWRDNGSAIIEFDDASGAFTAVRAPAIAWPTTSLTPASLAAAIDTVARTAGVTAVALDGPQGWRDPATDPALRGVGRRCELACRTQGKTGAYPKTYPGNQRRWIEFSIEVFDALLSRPGVVLANERGGCRPPVDGYAVIECFPTSAWRASGLKPLPGKGSRPALEPHARALWDAFALPEPRSRLSSHDDLQAVVAALCAVPVCGGPAIAVPEGVPAFVDRSGRRLEGLIWNVRPGASSAS